MKLVGASYLAVFLMFLVCCGREGLAQAPPSGGGAYLDSSTNWDFEFGGSYARASSNSVSGNVGGWNATLANFPYDSHPWIGGVIDFGGFYATSNGVSTQYYGAMGGPIVAVRSSRIQPFARFMLGTVDVRGSSSSSTGSHYVGLPYSQGAVGAATAAASTSSAASANHFGVDAGGGIDYPLTRRCALRLQADWTPFWVNSVRQDAIRAAVGLDFRF